MPTTRRGVQGLHKEEAMEVIKELGFPCASAWSSDELKQVIEGTLFPENETTAQKALKGHQLHDEGPADRKGNRSWGPRHVKHDECSHKAFKFATQSLPWSTSKS